MLLKGQTSDEKAKKTSITVPGISANTGKIIRNGMKMSVSGTVAANTLNRHRKVVRIPSKRQPGKSMSGKLHTVNRIGPGKILKTPGKRLFSRPNPPMCDNSNDSGLGFDHQDVIYQSPGQRSSNSSEQTTSTAIATTTTGLGTKARNGGGKNIRAILASETDDLSKRHKLDQIHIETDDACSNDAFLFVQQQKQLSNANCSGSLSLSSPPSSAPRKTIASLGKGGPRQGVRRNQMNPVNVQAQGGTGFSKNGRYQLQILAQPEQQHRARYQTEGSRGAVKDRSGNNFPIVKLNGYSKNAVLEVFIGTDVGRVAPHMFYQACKVAGKNSTPCIEKKVEGTMIIELELKPENEMTVTCDCVGILKERNVDVEHRFPDQSNQRSKKKSTRCRMVFRAEIINDDGTKETIQVCSQPIICTQPPGVPEISKKSLVSCPAGGGFEMFIIGKNFSKDTRVIFQRQKLNSGEVIWQEIVVPDKEYLQQTHLICTVPTYIDPSILEPITVQVFVAANGKKSEPHNFVYTPKNGQCFAIPSYSIQNHVIEDMHYLDDKMPNANGLCLTPTPSTSSLPQAMANPGTSASAWAMGVLEQQQQNTDLTDCGMMPPPNTILPLNIRRSSSGTVLSEQLSPSSSCSSNCSLKVEINDESSQSPTSDSNDHFQQQSLMLEHRIREEKSRMDLYNSPTSMMVPNSQVMSSAEINVVKEDRPTFMTEQNLLAGSAGGMGVSPMTGIQTICPTNTIHPMNHLQTTSDVGNPNTIQFTDQQLTTISNAMNLTNTSPSITSVMDIGLRIDTNTNHGSDQNLANNLNRSPLSSHDIILNSQNTIMNSPSTSSTTSQSTLSQLELPHNMSPDIILNPTVSPSVLCESMTTNTAVPAVQSLVDPILNIAQQPQNPVDNLVVIEPNTTLLDTIMSPVPAQQQELQQPIVAAQMKASQSSVQNMILNAAAEILSSQPSTITTESMHALISLNNATMLTQTISDSQSQQQAPPSQFVVNPGVEQVSNLLPPNPPQNIMQNQNPNPIGLNLINALAPVPNSTELMMQDIKMQTLHDGINHLNEPAVSSMLLNNTNTGNQVANTVESAAGSVPNQINNIGGLTNPTNVLTGPVVGNKSIPAPTPTTTATTIPQEIATMSEHDLISYINPQCFEQEFQNI